MTNKPNDGERDTEAEQELFSQLRQLDPVMDDPTPVVGSSRIPTAESIRLGATPVEDPMNNLVQPQMTRQPKRALLTAVAACLALFVAVGVVFALPASPSAAAALATAADNAATATDFKVEMRASDSLLPGGQGIALIDGGNAHFISDELEVFQVGDTMWISDAGGEYLSVPTGPQTPFSEASAEVVSAALEASTIEEFGDGNVRGQATTRYVVTLDDAARQALADVPAASQQWFTASTTENTTFGADGTVTESSRSGFLEDADSMSIWVADELIRRIQVDTGEYTFDFTYFDFGIDNVVTAPE